MSWWMQSDSLSCTDAAKQLAEVKGELEIRDVNFSYPQRPKVKVLRGFSLQARAGQTVALVGASGNGKSTIVGLIERWYDVTSGQVSKPPGLHCFLCCWASPLCHRAGPASNVLQQLSQIKEDFCFNTMGLAAACMWFVRSSRRQDDCAAKLQHKGLHEGQLKCPSMRLGSWVYVHVVNENP